jgi:hypothetical protein
MMKPKTTTYYIKCSEQEAEAIRSAAKRQQRTVHNWMRMIVVTAAKQEIQA